MAKVKEVASLGLIGKPQYIKEQFSGIVNDTLISFPKQLGSAHPFDFKQAEDLYKSFGFIAGVVDKYVDNVIDNFQIRVKNKNVQALINDFLDNSDFKVVLRNWLREALLKGNGFMEIDLENQQVRVLNANNMYVSRDKYGNIKGYNQYRSDFKNFSVNNMVSFKPNQIAHLKINVIADDPYGLGIIYPNMMEINRLLTNLKSLQDLLQRKAGAPIHAKVGIPGGLVNNSVIQQFANDLQTLNNKTEWVTDANVDMKVLDFGNISDKFTDILYKNLEMLYAGFQIPEVLMGSGQLNEGIAKVQLEGFQRRIRAIQEDVEQVIENSIFKPLLNSQKNKQFNTSVDISWSLPGETEINNRVSELSKLLQINTSLSNNMRRMVELDLARTLEFEDIDKYLRSPEVGLDDELEQTQNTENQNTEKKQEENIPQPELPGAKPNANQIGYPELKENVGTHKCEVCEKLDNGDITIQEWVNLQEVMGLKYSDYVAEIIKILKKDEFKGLKAITEQDLELGLLPLSEIEKLRIILKEGFRKNWTIRQMENEIKESIEMPDRFSINENGEMTLQMNKEFRPNAIARTETIRLANEGLVSRYKKSDVQEVRFLAALSDRTCPICEDLNGRVFNIQEMETGTNQPPIHTNCRCTLVPVITWNQ